MFVLAVMLLAQAAPVPPVGRQQEYVPPANVRCVTDSFGNLTCTDGTRVVKDANGGVTIIPGRR